MTVLWRQLASRCNVWFTCDSSVSDEKVGLEEMLSWGFWNKVQRSESSWPQDIHLRTWSDGSRIEQLMIEWLLFDIKVLWATEFERVTIRLLIS